MVIEIEGFFLELLKINFNNSRFILKNVIYNFSIFLLLVEYFIKLKYLSLNFEFNRQSKKEL